MADTFHLTEDDIDTICKLYREGLSSNSISKNYNLTANNILSILQTRGVKLRPRKRVCFTDEQEYEIIRLYLEGISMVIIGNKYNVSHSTIAKVIKNNNVVRDYGTGNQPKFSSSTQKAICQQYLEGQHSNQIATQYDVTHATILRVLRRSNIKVRSKEETSRKHYCQFDFFHQIDTQVKAYWLGFILADGNVGGKNSNVLQITLARQDRHHLESFLEDIDATYEVKDFRTEGGYAAKGYSENSKILITSKQLTNDLIRLGVIERKTFYETWPKLDDSTMYRHFVRGVFDGDGTIYGTTSRHSAFKIFSGSYQLLSEIQNYMVKELNLQFTKIYKSSSIYVLIYGGNKQVCRILTWLYNDAEQYLPRKKEIADFILNKRRHIGKGLKMQRNQLGLSVNEVANRVGMDKSTLYSIERNDHMPNFKTVQKLAKALGVNVQNLWI